MTRPSGVVRSAPTRSVGSLTVSAPDHRPPRSSAVRGVAAVVVVLGLAMSAPAAAAQTTSTTDDVTTSTANPLLVDGPAEAGPADGAVSQAIDPADEGAGDGVADEDEIAEEDDEAAAKVRLVMYALIVVAVLLAGLTVFYWWYTKPDRQPARASRPSRHRLERGETKARRRRTADPSPDDDGGTVDPWPTDSTSTR